MNVTVLIAVLAVLAFLLLAVVILLLLQLRKPPGDIGAFSTSLQNLTQTLQQGQTQIATLTEKVSHLTPVAPAVNQVQVELRGLTERVSQVEQHQSAVNQGIGSLATGLVQTETNLTAKVSDVQQQATTSLFQVSSGLTGEISRMQQESGSAMSELKALTAGLTEAAAAIRSELTSAKHDLTELQTGVKARLDIELRTAESIRRLEMIIAGTQSKGSAGENILEYIFAKLPVEWQVRNFKVGGRSVEFGLRLPNNLIVPIDSKWAATNLLEQFVASDDTAEQQRLKGDIENTVIQKAKEVRKYIDPSITVSFGVAVVPDAVYDVCSGIQAEVFQMNVVLVSYSMFIPYLLLIFQTTLKAGQRIDLQKLDAYLKAAQQSLQALQDELDGRFSKAVTMLNNTRDEMRVHIGRISSGITSLQVSGAYPDLTPALPDAEAP